MGIILAYDCTDECSFINVKNWVKQIEKHATPGVVKVLIGNKCDRSDKKVDTARGRALADDCNMAFFETSAKSNINVKETCIRVTNAMMQKKSRGKRLGCC